MNETLTLIACLTLAVLLFGLFAGPKFWVGVAWLGGCTVVVGLGTLAYQGLALLRVGYWTGGNFRPALAMVGLDRVSFSQSEFDSIVQWIASLPFAAGIILTGFLVIWIGMIGQIATLDRQIRGVHRQVRGARSR
ncbi:MAG TPA: hypothetical protein VEU53_12490 [Stellaceae bacterium]|nr:hypothetical protein [Stellaceae bacterium]